MAGEAGVGQAVGGLSSLIDAIAPVVASLHGMYDVVKGVSNVLNGLQKAADAFDKTFIAIEKSLNIMRDGLANAGNMVSRAMGPVESVFSDLFKTVSVATVSIADSIPYFGAVIAVAGSVVSAFLALLPAVLQVASGLVQLGLAALPGGLKVFGDAIDYLTVSLGQFLAPAITVLIAGIVTLADMLVGPMHDAANSFIDNALSAAVTAMGWFIDTIKSVISILPVMVTWLTNLVGWFAGSVGKLGTYLTVDLVALAFAWIDKIFGALWNVVQKIASITSKLFGGGAAQAERNDTLETAKATAGKNAKGLVAGRPATPDLSGAFAGLGNKGTESRIASNLPSVINALETELGKKGQVGFSGIADVQKQVQMNAIQNDLQARTLQVQVDILATLKERLGKQQAQQPTKK